MPSLTPRAYARITFACLFLLALIIVTGAAVRLTGSGLGCPDWPTCDGGQVVAPMRLHPWIEFGNRLLTGVVSVAVIAGVLGSLVRRPRRADLLWLSASLVVGVAAQAVLGGVTVHHKLDPKFVMAHFLLSMLIVWAAVVLHHRARADGGRRVPVTSTSARVLARGVSVLAAVVLFIGTMVTGTGPHGGDEHVVRLGFQPHDITKVHGAAVWALVLLTAMTMWRLHREHVTSTLRRSGEVVMIALLLQAAIGYLQYSLSVPAALVLVHVLGATVAWVAVLWFNLGFYEDYGPVDLASYDDDRGGLPDGAALARMQGPAGP